MRGDGSDSFWPTRYIRCEGQVGLMDKVTRERRQCSRGVYTPSSNVCSLGEELRGVHLPPRRGKYTRVYTTVYSRVHKCIHACTQLRSKYRPRRALVRWSPGLSSGSLEFSLERLSLDSRRVDTRTLFGLSRVLTGTALARLSQGRHRDSRRASRILSGDVPRD